MVHLGHLNAPQREAVLHRAGPLVVFAGAGSGKTRVITHRVAHLVAEHAVPPWRILAVTFTNKAAGEMRERLGQLIPQGASELWVGTFHATCARLLRRYHEGLGLRRDFNIYDDQDQQALVKRILRDMELDERRYAPRQVASLINRAKQEVLGPDEMPTDDYFEERVRDVFRTYEDHMTRSGALDFGDLIYRLVRGLEADPALREEVAGRFQHVLVDEFQDTNHAQLRLVSALASGHRNLCVVGDDDQSIYRWRGADRRNILDFRKSFPDAKVVKLEQNYRSTQRILRVAHSVIHRNRDREPKELWTANPEGDPIVVVRCADEREEARTMLRAVVEMKSQGLSLDDMVVFYRIHAQSRVLEEELRTHDVPYRIVGGLRFYDRAEVKDLLAYLRVVHNPDDDVSLLRILNTPPRGIGKTTVERVLDRAAQTGVGVFAALVEASGPGGGAKAAAAKKLGAFVDLVRGLRERAEGGASLVDLASAVLEDTGYRESLEAQDTPEADARLENLSELLGSMDQMLGEEPSLRLEEYLERVALETSADEGGHEEKLTLMTVHAAKGLEFPFVMVTGLEEALFPYKGTEIWDDPEELEEERRLAYVAFTRAEKKLVLSHVGVRRLFGQAQPKVPSRFLSEIPADDVVQVGGPQRRPAPARSGRDDWRSRYDRSARVGSQRSFFDDGDAPAEPAAAPRHPKASSGETYLDVSEGSDFSSPGETLRRGARVRHAQFGWGSVRAVDLGGMHPKATVRFDSGVEKTVLARFLSPG